MKILYSCLSRSWGGMEMFTITAAQNLLARGIETHILCYPESSLHKASEKAGIVTHTSKTKTYFSPFEILKLRKLIKSEDYTLVHTQASKDLWLLSPALYLTKKRISLFLTKQVGSYIVKKDLLHRFIYKRVNKVFAISKVIERNLLDTCPIPKEKIYLLHNGVDIAKFNPADIDKTQVRNELGIQSSEIVLGMTSRFSFGKGHEEFLLALSALNKEFPNLRALIVGEASFGEKEYEAKIKQLAVNLNLTNIIYTGFRSDTNRMFAAMDIFVFPSHSEAFGIALVEAMAIGTASVCSNSDGILDIAIDGETSFLFEKQNAEDLTAKLRKLITSPETRMKFAANARQRAIDYFDMKSLTNKVISVYKEYTSS